MGKNTAYRHKSEYLDDTVPLANYREIEKLVYNADGSSKSRDEAEEKTFLRTVAVEVEELVALIKQVPDDRLHAYALKCADNVVDPKDPMVTRSNRKSSVYGSDGFPVDGPAYMVFINAPRTIKNKVYTSRWFDEHDRMVGELKALAS